VVADEGLLPTLLIPPKECSILYYIFPLPVCLLTFLYAKWQRFDARTIALLFVAVSLYYFHFYHTRWDQFTIDAQSHAGYVSYIAQHDALPTQAVNSATRHPPAFYIVAAGLYKLAQYTHSDPLQTARHVSMMCFIVFILMGISMLRLLLPQQTSGYYAGVLLLLFWPIGVTMGARLMCDILLYATEAFTLYALAGWCQKNDPLNLSKAFIGSGLCVLAKSTGLLMLLLTVGALAIMLYEYRRKWRELLNPPLLLSISFMLVCCLLTFGREQHWTTWLIISGTLAPVRLFWLDTFGSFNVFLFAFDTNSGLSSGMFWNMLLHSLMLGNGDIMWKAVYIPILLNVLWLVILIYLVEGLIRFGGVLIKDRSCILLWVFCLIMIGAMVFMRIRLGNPQYADARYIYPVVIAVALFFGRIIDLNQQAGRLRLYRLGMAVAFSFLLLSPTLFFIQYPINFSVTQASVDEK